MIQRSPDERSGAVEFTLPRGFAGEGGVLHRDGFLRPSTAGDEIKALGDFRALLWPESFDNIILARVVVKLGTLPRVDFGILQALDAVDREYLARLYEEMNAHEPA